MSVARTGSRPASWVVAILLAGGGCGYEGDLPATTKPPTPPPAPTQAGIALSLSSSPITALAVGSGGSSWTAQWSVTVRETSGVGGSIALVRASLTASSGASLGQTELDAGQVSAQLGGSNHIGAGASRDVAMTLGFDFPVDVSTATLNVTVQVNDERGNAISASVADVVQICVPVLLAPAEAAQVDNGCSSGANGILWEFDWSECAGAEAYEFYVRQRTAQEPLFDRPELTTSSFTVLENRAVPEESRYDWYWKVRAKVNGTWGNWTADRTFTIEPVNAYCVKP